MIYIALIGFFVLMFVVVATAKGTPPKSNIRKWG